MADVYLEHLIAKQMPVSTMLARVGLFVGVLVVSVVIMFIQAIAFMAPFVLVFGFWGAIWLCRRMRLEFEYILTNGELDVDKIMGRSARKRMLTVDCRKFDILAPMKPQYQGEYANATKTIDVSSSPQSPHRWFAVYSEQAGRTVLIFEPNERMLAAFRTYIPRKMQS